MFHWVQNPLVAKYSQLGLILAYAVLATMFTLHKKTWPIAIYYTGCFVKDTSVFLLAFLMKWFT